MKRHALLLATGLAGALLLAGCSTFDTVKTADGDKVKYQVIASGKTEGRLEVLQVNAARAGDLLRAAVELRNDSDFSYNFQYRYKWYDAAGMEVNPDATAWTPATMSGNETKTIGATAPNPSATTFKLFLQD